MRIPREHGVGEDRVDPRLDGGEVRARHERAARVAFSRSRSSCVLCPMYGNPPCASRASVAAGETDTKVKFWFERPSPFWSIRMPVRPGNASGPEAREHEARVLPVVARAAGRARATGSPGGAFIALPSGVSW